MGITEALGEIPGLLLLIRISLLKDSQAKEAAEPGSKTTDQENGNHGIKGGTVNIALTTVFNEQRSRFDHN